MVIIGLVTGYIALLTIVAVVTTLTEESKPSTRRHVK